MLSSLKNSLGQTLKGGSEDFKKLQSSLASLEEVVRDLVREVKSAREEAKAAKEEVLGLKVRVEALEKSGAGGTGGPQSGGSKAGSAGSNGHSMAEAISVQLAVAPEQKPAKLNGHNGHHAKAEPAATLSAPVASEILVEAAVEPPVEPVVPVVSAPQVAAPVGAATESTSLSDAVQKALKGGRMIHADTGSTDLAAYVARAKANGRSLESVCGGEGMNTAADGEQFWGPVDNESSRAKASGKVLTIDQFECIACGTCVEQTDKVFYLPNEAKATPIAQDGPMDLIQDAIDECPVTCISWVPTEEAAERGLATGAEYLE